MDGKLRNMTAIYLMKGERSTKGEIRQNYYFFARLKENVGEEFTSTEGVCKWFLLNELEGL